MALGKPYRVLVTGSRTWDRQDIIFEALDAVYREMLPLYGPDAEMRLIHGACPQGADAIAHEWWEKNNSPWVTVDTYPADWEKYGKRAGFIRNQQMVESKPDVCYAFWRGGSKGTERTITLAKRAGIFTVVFNYPERS